MMRALENVDEAELQKMMEHATGQSCYDDRDTIMQKMGSMDDNHFMRAVFGLESQGKQQLISGMLQEKPELFEEFSADAMTHPFTMMQKGDVLKALTVLDTEQLLPMVEQLPQDIMALIATQIQPEMFAKILTSDFKDVIASCGMNV